jgi:hypothetical protein
MPGVWGAAVREGKHKMLKLFDMGESWLVDKTNDVVEEYATFHNDWDLKERAATKGILAPSSKLDEEAFEAASMGLDIGDWYEGITSEVVRHRKEEAIARLVKERLLANGRSNVAAVVGSAVGEMLYNPATLLSIPIATAVGVAAAPTLAGYGLLTQMAAGFAIEGGVEAAATALVQAPLENIDPNRNFDTAREATINGLTAGTFAAAIPPIAAGIKALRNVLPSRTTKNLSPDSELNIQIDNMRDPEPLAVDEVGEVADEAAEIITNKSTVDELSQSARGNKDKAGTEPPEASKAQPDATAEPTKRDPYQIKGEAAQEIPKPKGISEKVGKIQLRSTFANMAYRAGGDARAKDVKEAVDAVIQTLEEAGDIPVGSPEHSTAVKRALKKFRKDTENILKGESEAGLLPDGDIAKDLSPMEYIRKELDRVADNKAVKASKQPVPEVTPESVSVGGTAKFNEALDYLKGLVKAVPARSDVFAAVDDAIAALRQGEISEQDLFDDLADITADIPSGDDEFVSALENYAKEAVDLKNARQKDGASVDGPDPDADYIDPEGQLGHQRHMDDEGLEEIREMFESGQIDEAEYNYLVNLSKEAGDAIDELRVCR